MDLQYTTKNIVEDISGILRMGEGEGDWSDLSMPKYSGTSIGLVLRKPT